MTTGHGQAASFYHGSVTDSRLGAAVTVTLVAASVALVAGCRGRDRQLRDGPLLADSSLSDGPSADRAPVDTGGDSASDGDGGGCLQPPDAAGDLLAWDVLAADVLSGDLALDDGMPDHGDGAGLDGADGAAADGDAGGPCPPGMVLVSPTQPGSAPYCIDRYEASRPDATSTSQGVLAGAPLSIGGVIPWHSSTLTSAEAAAACGLAGKRLCTAAEWQIGCAGPQETVYAYGDDYDPVICNGIDRFCYCGEGSACADVTPCPYAHCFKTCGAMVIVRPTGTHPGCTNDWGVLDMNGNVWEVVQTDDGLDHYRGGAFNCINSELLHRCDTDAANPLSRGFRCCADPG